MLDDVRVNLSEERYTNLLKKEKSIEKVKKMIGNKIFLDLLNDIKKNSPEYFNGDYGEWDLRFHFKHLADIVGLIEEDTLEQ